MAPTSHMPMRAGTPPNEHEENHSQKDDDQHSPIDSDGSHSYHEDIPTGYVHQTSYHGINGSSTLDISTNGDPKNAMNIMQPDIVRKDYLTNSTLMDPSMINDGWGYQ
jgi:hypothetical protein